jgi:Skp family chaperone for outer membrane proteins
MFECCRCVVQAGSPPDVWQQLLRDCAEELACAPAVTGSILQQLTQLRREHQQELAAARAEAAAAAAKAAAEAAAAAAKAAAATAEAAELRGQLQALQGQMQEVRTALKQRQP